MRFVKQKAASVSTRRKTLPKVKIILVKWEDATHIQDETGPETIGTMIAWTVGVQVHRTKKEVALCMEIFEDGQKRNISTIPMGMVKTILTLARIPIHTHEA